MICPLPAIPMDVLTQLFLHRSCGQFEHFVGWGWGLQLEGLMRSLVVVEANSVANDSAGVLQTLESVTMHALVFESADHPLHHAVLFWAVGRDDLLLQTVALDQRCVAAACEDQAVVRT